MKILHYLFGLPPVRTGGVPQYAIDLMTEQQKMGHMVSMLVPGRIFFHNRNNISICKCKKVYKISSYEINNPLYIPNAYGIKEPYQFMRKVSVSVYEKWLVEMKFDIIHIHSILGIHFEFFEAATKLGIPILFTTHDFFGLCPKIDLLKNNVSCTLKDWSECIHCCYQAYSINRLTLEQSRIYRIYCNSSMIMNIVHRPCVSKIKDVLVKVKGVLEKKTPATYDNFAGLINEYNELNLYYKKIFSSINYFHYNSDQTKRIFESRLGSQNGSVLTLLNKGIKDRRERRNYGQLLRLGYLGSHMPFKGYEFLLENLNRMFNSGRQNFVVNTYVKEETRSFPFIRNHRPFSRDMLANVYNSMDVLIVPSICQETFGMVVLEAMSYGVPVVVSEYVGARMILEKHPGTGKIFSLSNDCFLEVIQEIYDNRHILDDMNLKILSCNINFDFMYHVQEVINLYSKCRKKD